MAGDSEPEVLDAGLIAAAQKIEHYEIAAYGCARTYAKLLKQDEASGLSFLLRPFTGQAEFGKCSISHPSTIWLERLDPVKDDSYQPVIGTARINPIPPQSQPQNSNATVTASGFRCSRLPSNLG